MEPPSGKPRWTIRPTRAGWIWLGISFTLWAIGLYKGINLLVLLAYVMLLVGGGNALLARRQLRGVRARRRIDTPVFAGEPVKVELTVELTQPGPRLGVRVEDQGPDQTRCWFLDLLTGPESRRRSDEATAARRGWHSWQTLSLASGYPFGLIERRLPQGSADSVLVFPALGRLHRGRLRSFLFHTAPGNTPVQHRRLRHPSAQSEYHGLREFRPGDSQRWIHWRTSARRGELMVREFDEPPADDLILVLEPWLTPDEPGRARLEAAISFAATVCWDWCQPTGARLILAVAGAAEPIVCDGRTGSALAHLMLEVLALTTGQATLDGGRLVARLTALPAAPTAVMVVSSGTSDFGEELAHRLRRPVARVRAAELDALDFYQGPGSI